MTNSDDRLVAVLLCSTVGRPTGRSVASLGPVGWSELSARVRTAEIPMRALFDMTATDMTAAFDLTADQAIRVATLLAGAGPVAIELERLADRGFWFMTDLDDDYPGRLRDTLRAAAPPVMFGSGDRPLLGTPTVAIVGSRDAPLADLEFARAMGAACARGGFAVSSGGARGVDTEATTGAYDAGGVCVLVLVEQLERRVRDPFLRQAIVDKRMTAVSPYPPGAGFSVRAAMGRNKIVYGLASAAIVVSVKHRTGGTWAGADEALRGHWLPVFVRRSQDAGSAGLVGLGARELPWEMPPPSVSVEDLTSQALSNIETPVQDTLFDMEPASPKSRRSRKSRPH